MALFWCRTKQAQLRALSNQFKRCYFQLHGSSLVIQETRMRVVNSPNLPFQRNGSELRNYVRFFAAPVQVKPKTEEKDKGRPRMNEQIFAQYVRLVTDEGHSVVSRYEALEQARRLNVDLVEVQPDGKPPVCKLMDYKKERYLRHAKEKEKEQTKKKSDLVLRKGALKEVRITHKIDKNDLQTKADAVKRLTERGHRVKCMAVGTADQDLGGLLSRLSDLIDDFCLVESGPMVEAKQAYMVVRHVKFGPLKKGPGKKKILGLSNGNTSTQNPERLEQSSDESDLETEEDLFAKEAVESDAPADFDISINKAHDHTGNYAPETPNRDRTGSENRYAATRQTNASATGSENRYAATRQTNASGTGSENRYAATRQTNASGTGSENRYAATRQTNASATGSENRYAATRQTNASATGSEHRYATTRQTNASVPGARRRFEPESQNPGSNRQLDLNWQGPSGEPKPNIDPLRESGPVEVNRYKKGPNSRT